MPIVETSDFILSKAKSCAIMGIDHGNTIGIAIADPSWSIASPLVNIHNKKFTNTAAEIFKIIDERKVGGIVIGLPLNMDGSENKQCQSARQFGRNLIKIRDIDITFFDERFSSIMAEKALLEADISWDRREELVDKVAAGYILQSFIDKAIDSKMIQED